MTGVKSLQGSKWLGQLLNAISFNNNCSCGAGGRSSAGLLHEKVRQLILLLNELA
jgi:hypothetical protein